MINTAFAKDELYEGFYAKNAPDVTIITENGYTLQEGFPHVLVCPSILFGMDRSGDHRSEGIFIACGPNIRKQETSLEARIIDIMPTVLYLNNIPIFDYIDGNIRTEWIKENCLQERPVEKTQDTFVLQPQIGEMTAEEREILENHLRALGYF